MIESLYEDYVLMKEIGIFSGKTKEPVRLVLDREHLPKTAIINAFLADDDIQEIRIASANLGFVRTFTKVYKKRVTT